MNKTTDVVELQAQVKALEDENSRLKAKATKQVEMMVLLLKTKKPKKRKK